MTNPFMLSAWQTVGSRGDVGNREKNYAMLCQRSRLSNRFVSVKKVRRMYIRRM